MKNAIIATFVALALVGGALYFAKGTATQQTADRAARDAANQNNVAMEGGTQVVTIHVSGGYAPSISHAKAGVPTVLRFVADNAYDCSAALAIPAFNVREVLQPTETKDFSVPAQEAGATVSGSCQMGMYTFAVQFN